MERPACGSGQAGKEKGVTAGRIEALREQMRQRGIDIYLVPTADFHASEYVGDHFKARQYLTGFTGSAGTAAITMEEAGLWTDGRYFIQASRQLEGSPVVLFRQGEENVPKLKEYIREHLREGGCLGFDGRVVSAKDGLEYEKIASERHGRIAASEDLAGAVWEGRPPLPHNPAFLLEERYAGESAASKLGRLREAMREKGAGVHILTSLCDIAWLLNIRGSDISHVPVVLSFAVVTEEACLWFLQEGVLDEELIGHCRQNGVTVMPYGEIYGYAARIAPGEKVLLDESVVNYRIFSSLAPGVEKIDAPNPTERMKAVKNETELANLQNAHVKDGVAFVKFLRWLKTSVGRQKITERSAADRLESLRREQDLFLDVSFDTISAYGEHAAMMHYAATPETDAELRPEGFLLVDSGGHYLEGSTDVTRTIALGPLSERQKRHFTAVCRANIGLAAAKFLHGCRGANLDILAREPLWQMGADYRCGTGHGIGYLLNVHEGPNRFSWKMRQGERVDCVLEEGMVTTDEPGIYLEGEYGIRTENELICKKAEKNEYGQFMEFETVTYAPIDLDAVLPEEMTAAERGFLNDYHEMVYRKLSPFLTGEEREWLREQTRAV